MTRMLNMPRSATPAGRPRPVSEHRHLRAVPRKTGFLLLDKAITFASGQRVSTKQLLVLTTQLSTMLGAGCDLCAGLDALARQQSHPYLKKVMLDLSDSVQAGQAFSQALAEHPDVFGPIYVTMIRAGETAGMLRNMLQGLQVMLRNQMRVASAIRSALMYPSILTCVAITAIIVMTTFVLPKFALVFKNSRVPLPTLTTLMLDGSEFVGAHACLLLVSLLLFITGLAWLATRPALRVYLHTWSLQFPLIGKTLRISYVVRSIQTMGTLLKSGLPVADSLLLIRDLMQNVHYRSFFEELHEHISEGKPLVPDFEQTTLFPPMVGQMIGVGEQTGTLPTVCTEIAGLYEEEMHERIKIMTTALEPAIIVLLGGFVALIAISVILPMFKISSALK